MKGMRLWHSVRLCFISRAYAFDAFAQKRLEQSAGVGKKSVSQYWQEFENERE